MKYARYGLMGCGGVTLAIVALVVVAVIASAIWGTPEEEVAADEVVSTTTTEATTTTSTTTTQAPTTTQATTTTTQAATTTTEWVPSESELETLYVWVIRDIVTPEYPDFKYVDDEMIVDIGQEMCNIIDQAKADGDEPNITMIGLALMNMEQDDPEFGATMTGAALGAAPEAFCPEHMEYASEMIEYASTF